MTTFTTSNMSDVTENRVEPVFSRLTPEEADRVRVAARSEYRTISSWIRIAALEKLDRDRLDAEHQEGAVNDAA